MKKEPNVKIYTTTTCPWCVKTKEFLKENNITFKEVDIKSDEKARNEVFDKSGQFGVPVIDIDGTIIVGYDRTALKKALKLS